MTLPPETPDAAAIESAIRHIHDSRWRFVIATTGGGSSVISQLLRVPGGSRSVLEGIVPYSQEALVRYLGSRVEHFCSSRTARAMAMTAFQRARTLVDDHQRSEPPSTRPDFVRAELETIAGVACTASLASEPPKRGPHRCHIAIQTSRRTRTISVELLKGARSRGDEEAVVTSLMLGEIASLATNSSWTPALFEREIPVVVETIADPAMERLASGRPGAAAYRDGVRVEEVTAASTGSAPGAGRTGRVLIPGAFHPIHEGHLAMARIAEGLLGKPVEFEISVTNVDKPPLDFTEISERLEKMPPRATTWLTNAPTFVEKARLFPGATFIVGADTIVRIGDPKYYAHQSSARDAALDELQKQDARFLVFGRQCGGDFKTLDSLLLPEALASICSPVKESDFRSDISSTAIRQRDPHFAE